MGHEVAASGTRQPTLGQALPGGLAQDTADSFSFPVPPAENNEILLFVASADVDFTGVMGTGWGSGMGSPAAITFVPPADRNAFKNQLVRPLCTAAKWRTDPVSRPRSQVEN